MPSSATVTTYYTFSANTKARASQVNANFSNHRGHNIPINTNTATASDNTHDLGASDHYWRSAYLGEVDLRTSTTTATLILKGDTSATLGAFLFQIEGVTKAVINSSGFNGNYMQSATVYYWAMVVNPNFQWTEFNANGSWTIPAGVNNAIYEMCGGGGGGGCGIGGDAGGGQGAPKIVGFISSLTPGTVLSITVGAGGAADSGSGTGGTGGTSYIGSLPARGGVGGRYGTAGGVGGGSGGAGGLGEVGGAIGGDAGAAGQGSGIYAGGAAGSGGGGGGGGAGPYGVGGDGCAHSGSVGGSAAANTGAGGGGGDNVGATNGGAGGSGKVRIGWIQNQ